MNQVHCDLNPDNFCDAQPCWPTLHCTQSMFPFILPLHSTQNCMVIWSTWWWCHHQTPECEEATQLTEIISQHSRTLLEEEQKKRSWPSTDRVSTPEQWKGEKNRVRGAAVASPYRIQTSTCAQKSFFQLYRASNIAAQLTGNAGYISVLTWRWDRLPWEQPVETYYLT